MHEYSFNNDFLKVRRAQKAIQDDDWIKSFLNQTPVGVLATVFQDQPFLSVKLFVYNEDQHIIYLHSANSGRFAENLSHNPRVCFTAFEMGRFLPAQKARDFGVEYQSVVVFGTARLVLDEAEILTALQLTMEKYAPQFVPGKDYPPITKKDLPGVAVFRLEIMGWSAKADQGEVDHPGAYCYEDLPLRAQK